MIVNAVSESPSAFANAPSVLRVGVLVITFSAPPLTGCVTVRTVFSPAVPTVLLKVFSETAAAPRAAARAGGWRVRAGDAGRYRAGGNPPARQACSARCRATAYGGSRAATMKVRPGERSL